MIGTKRNASQTMPSNSSAVLSVEPLFCLCQPFRLLHQILDNLGDSLGGCLDRADQQAARIDAQSLDIEIQLLRIIRTQHSRHDVIVQSHEG